MASTTKISSPEKLLTTPQAADVLGVLPNHLEKLRVFGGGP